MSDKRRFSYTKEDAQSFTVIRKRPRDKSAAQVKSTKGGKVKDEKKS